MESKLDFSLVASFVDKVTAPMRAVANQTDGCKYPSNQGHAQLT